MKEEDETAILKKFSEGFILSPEHWNTCVLPIDLEWQVQPFADASKNNIPDNQGGVYTFLVQPGIANHPACSYLCYVGKAEKQSLRKRFQQYLFEKNNAKTKRFAIRRMLNWWDGHLHFCFAPIGNETIISTVEQLLLDSYIPPFNQQFIGAVGAPVKAL